MAVTLKLVRRADEAAEGSDISSISLLAFTNGVQLDYYDGWPQAIPAGMEPGNVFETLRLHVKGTSHNSLASYIQGLDDKCKEATWYWDSDEERYGVWLRTQLAGETYRRQSLVRRMSGKVGESIYGPYTDTGYVMRSYTLGIERLPWWEDIALNTETENNVACNGSSTELSFATHPLRGDVPGRVSSTIVDADDPINEIWMGFRSARWGTVANFVSRWQTGLGTVIADTGTTDEGDWMSCDFCAGDCEEMQTRFYVEVQDVTANYQDQRGEFMVLLRAQLSSGSTTCYVRLLDGYSSTDDYLRQQDRVKIESTNWMLYPLGTVRMPPASAVSGYNLLKTYRLAMQAQRTAGAGELNFDYFMLVPIGEGGIYAGGLGLGINAQALLYTHPDGRMAGWTYTDGNRTDVVEAIAPSPQGPYGYTIPAALCNVIFASQRAAEHDETDVADLTFNVLRRWRTLRGVDA